MRLSIAIGSGAGALTIAGALYGLAGEAQSIRQQAELGAEAAVKVEQQEKKLEGMQEDIDRSEWMQYQILKKVAPEAAEMIPEPEQPR